MPLLEIANRVRLGRKPATWTRIDRDYEQIRIDMHSLFHNPTAPAHYCWLGGVGEFWCSGLSGLSRECFRP